MIRCVLFIIVIINISHLYATNNIIDDVYSNIFAALVLKQRLPEDIEKNFPRELRFYIGQIAYSNCLIDEYPCSVCKFVGKGLSPGVNARVTYIINKPADDQSRQRLI